MSQYDIGMTALALSSAPTCPKCGDANTQPLHAVHATGTTTSSSSTIGGAVGLGAGGMAPVVGGASTSTTAQSLVAKACAPPDKEPVAMLLVAGAVVAGIAAFIALGVTERYGPAKLWGGGILALAALAAWAGAKHNREVWPVKHAEWRRRWLCHRCHEHFEPGAPVPVEAPAEARAATAPPEVIAAPAPTAAPSAPAKPAFDGSVRGALRVLLWLVVGVFALFALMVVIALVAGVIGHLAAK